MDNQKICKHCGKEVTAVGRTLFCCAKCQSIFYTKKQQQFKINCKHCDLSCLKAIL